MRSRVTLMSALRRLRFAGRMIVHHDDCRGRGNYREAEHFARVDKNCKWRRGSESNRDREFLKNSLLNYYHSTTRGVQPHNCRTPIESGIFECVSTTRHYA
jgi:hypothetical protein